MLRSIVLVQKKYPIVFLKSMRQIPRYFQFASKTFYHPLEYDGAANYVTSRTSPHPPRLGISNPPPKTNPGLGFFLPWLASPSPSGLGRTKSPSHMSHIHSVDVYRPVFVLLDLNPWLSNVLNFNKFFAILPLSDSRSHQCFRSFVLNFWIISRFRRVFLHFKAWTLVFDTVVSFMMHHLFIFFLAGTWVFVNLIKWPGWHLIMWFLLKNDNGSYYKDYPDDLP